MGIKLSKNEKKTLKLLIENSRTSDSEIANKLKISSQAVGKIRKKLEETIIDSYTVNLKYEKLDITTFAIAIAKMTSEGLDKGHLEVEQILLKDENILQIYRLPRGTETHVLIMGFKDIDDMDDFFHSNKKINEIHKYLQTKEMYTFSHNSLIKNNPNQLFNKVIDSLDTPQRKVAFSELENFKRRLE